MTDRHCRNCDKLVEPYVNYVCSWACMIEIAKKAGGRVFTPNGLPIGSINANNDMYEHEHGDHPTYKFPVDVEYIGIIEPEGWTNVALSPSSEYLGSGLCPGCSNQLAP